MNCTEIVFIDAAIGCLIPNIIFFGLFMLLDEGCTIQLKSGNKDFGPTCELLFGIHLAGPAIYIAKFVPRARKS